MADRKNLYIAVNGAVTDNLGASVETPRTSIINAITTFKSEIEALINRAGQDGKLAI